jgi:hypothetical protein
MRLAMPTSHSQMHKRRPHVAQTVEAILGVDAEDGEAIVFQESRLAGADDDEIKEIEPLKVALLLLGEAADMVHHHVGVVPQRVRGQEDLPRSEFQVGGLGRLVLALIHRA